MKTKKTKLKLLNHTKGYRLNKNELHQLSATFHNGKVYSYFGKTKKECEQQFKDSFGTWNGFILKEWTIYCS